MPLPFSIPENVQAGDAVLARCPVCDELVHVLVVPADTQYIAQVVQQMTDGLRAHEQRTGHDKTARARARERAR